MPTALLLTRLTSKPLSLLVSNQSSSLRCNGCRLSLRGEHLIRLISKPLVQLRSNKRHRQEWKKQIAAQKQMQAAADRSQREMMEQMMNQPTFSARQATLPKVQYNTRAPQPMPDAPAPPPQMNISAAPAPQLVNTSTPWALFVRAAQPAPASVNAHAVLQD